MALSSLTGTLTPAVPFDFNQSLRFVARFNPRQGEPARAAGGITQAVRIEGRTVVFRVESTGTIETPRLADTT
jgi:hypothetical protein